MMIEVLLNYTLFRSDIRGRTNFAHDELHHQ
jgi:hypothetical protein